MANPIKTISTNAWDKVKKLFGGDWMDSETWYGPDHVDLNDFEMSKKGNKFPPNSLFLAEQQDNESYLSSDPLKFLVVVNTINNVTVLTESGDEYIKGEFHFVMDELGEDGIKIIGKYRPDFAAVNNAERKQETRVSNRNTGDSLTSGAMTHTERMKTTGWRASKKLGTEKTIAELDFWFDSLIENRDEIIEKMANISTPWFLLTTEKFFEQAGIETPPNAGKETNDMASKLQIAKRK